MTTTRATCIRRRRRGGRWPGRCADGPVFCGDAIADPLTGLEAASAVVDSLSRGGGEVIERVDGRGGRELRGACRPARRPPNIQRRRRRYRRACPPARRIGAPTMTPCAAWSPKDAGYHADSAGDVAGRCDADIRVGARIDEVGDTLVAGPGESVLDAGGGTVLPGLHDHHVHLRSAAAALDSLLVGPPAVCTKGQLAQRCRVPRRAPTGGFAPSAITSRSPGELDRTPWTVVPRISRCASSTAAARCGSSTPRRWPGSAWPTTRRAAARSDRGWSDGCSRARPTWPN